MTDYIEVLHDWTKGLDLPPRVRAKCPAHTTQSVDIDDLMTTTLELLTEHAVRQVDKLSPILSDNEVRDMALLMLMGMKTVEITDLLSSAQGQLIGGALILAIWMAEAADGMTTCGVVANEDGDRAMALSVTWDPESNLRPWEAVFPITT